MKVKLVFTDWKDGSGSVYNTTEGISLSAGDFHSGTTFNADIKMDKDAEEDLKLALADGYFPVFYIARPIPVR